MRIATSRSPAVGRDLLDISAIAAARSGRGALLRGGIREARYWGPQ